MYNTKYFLSIIFLQNCKICLRYFNNNNKTQRIVLNGENKNRDTWEIYIKKAAVSFTFSVKIIGFSANNIVKTDQITDYSVSFSRKLDTNLSTVLQDIKIFILLHFISVGCDNWFHTFQILNLRDSMFT